MGKHLGCDVDWSLAPEGTVFYAEGYFRDNLCNFWDEYDKVWMRSLYTREQLLQANDYEPKPEESEMEYTAWERLVEDNDGNPYCANVPLGAVKFEGRKWWNSEGQMWDNVHEEWIKPAPDHTPVKPMSQKEVVKKLHPDAFAPKTTQWTATHYDNYYQLTEADIKAGKIKIDAYFVNKMWKLNQKDDTGGLFHSLKTIARFGEKNPIERELKALYNQTKRMAELYGVELE